MSKPHDKQNPPALPGQTKTLVVTEGTPNCVLVIDLGSSMVKVDYFFPDPSHALEWCRRHRANMLYTPAAPNN